MSKYGFGRQPNYMTLDFKRYGPPDAVVCVGNVDTTTGIKLTRDVWWDVQELGNGVKKSWRTKRCAR